MEELDTSFFEVQFGTQPWTTSIYVDVNRLGHRHLLELISTE